MTWSISSLLLGQTLIELHIAFSFKPFFLYFFDNGIRTSVTSQHFLSRCKAFWLATKHHHSSHTRQYFTNSCFHADSDPSPFDCSTRINFQSTVEILDSPAAKAETTKLFKIQFLSLMITDNLNFLVCRFNFAIKPSPNLTVSCSTSSPKRKKRKTRYAELYFILGKSNKVKETEKSRFNL